MIPLLALAACGLEPADTAISGCDPRVLDAGEVRVKPVECSEELPEQSEGRSGDLLVQNSVLSVVLRQPAESLTLLGLPGLTIVDATPPGWRDRILEAVPVVDGGWLQPERVESGTGPEGAWVSIEGEIAGIPGLDPPEGGQGRLRYVLPPDRPELLLEGAEGLYLHGSRGAQPVGGGLARGGLRILTPGTIARDLGGAIVLAGADRLVVAQATDAHAALWPDGPHASGSCAGDHVDVLARDDLPEAGQVMARLEADFDDQLPPGAGSLVCLADGHAPGEQTPLGEDLELHAGAEGWLQVRAVGEDRHDLDVVVQVDGQSFPVPGEGGLVPAGPGPHEIVVEHGPAFDPWQGEVEVDGLVRLELVLRRAIDTSGWALLDLQRDASPSYSSRVEEQDDLALAAASGIQLAIQAPPGEIGTPYATVPWASRLRQAGGSRARTDSQGEVLSWPWSPDPRHWGHGAVPWRGLAAEDVLALSATAARITAVDAAWVQAAGPPQGWDPRPDLLLLQGPQDLPVLLDLLDHGVRLGVAGPLTWSPASTDPLPSTAACERGLLTGDSVAGTGPLLVLEGGRLPDLLGGRAARLRLEANAAADLESVELWVDGQQAASYPLDQEHGLLLDRTVSLHGRRYALAVATGPRDWAVSAPLWLD